MHRLGFFAAVAISGGKILSGQESMYSDGSFPSGRDRYMNRKTGKYPAVSATDLGDQRTNLTQTRGQAIDNMIAYHKKGSIVALQYHMVQPGLADGSGFDATLRADQAKWGFEGTQYNADAETPGKGAATILLVEHEHGFRNLVRSLLKGKGRFVLEPANGEDIRILFISGYSHESYIKGVTFRTQGEGSTPFETQQPLGTVERLAAAEAQPTAPFSGLIFESGYRSKQKKVSTIDMA